MSVRIVKIRFACCMQTGIKAFLCVSQLQDCSNQDSVCPLPITTDTGFCLLWGQLCQQKHASGSRRSPLKGRGLTLSPQITIGTGRMDTEGHPRVRSSTCFFRGFLQSRARFCVPCSRSKLWHCRPEFIPEAIKHLISQQNTWYHWMLG